MSSLKQEAWEWAKAIAIGLLVIVVLRSFFVTNYTVSGQSMMPTLQNQDRVLVSKISKKFGDIDRLDLVVFHSDENEDYVKRIIGVPGDVITYENDTLYVNEERVEEPFLKTYEAYNDPNDRFTEDFTLESLTGKKQVPEGSYFVLGDNRRQSLDSRYFQFVKKDEMVGKLVARYWPMETATIRFNENNPE